MARILTLSGVSGQPVGGKAEGLARLEKMGLRVPPTRILVEAQPGFRSPEILRAIEPLGPGPLAVRSSALGEDGAESSFAGQYETILNVEGEAALFEAIDQCLASTESARAKAYRSDIEDGEAGPPMSIVLQRMVDAQASGVCFTVDPFSDRRNRLILDSVVGLGESLVSGEASPDHDELRRSSGEWEPRQCVGEKPALSEDQRAQLANEALQAEAAAGEPLDLEWAIDRDGTLYWLQARPITTLGLDPQVLDTPPMEPGDVFTRCNVGEMMPGAVSPLTFSTCARGIDVGWQDNLITLGVRPERSASNVYIGMSHGHLFINLSEGARFASAVTGSHPDEQSLAICGRIVPEVVAPSSTPLWVRGPRTLRQVWSIVRAQPQIRAMERLVADGAIEVGANARDTWRAIDRQMESLYEAYARHLIVSSGAGALTPILLRVLAGREEPSAEHHALVGHLLAGAENVESADIATGAKIILEALLKVSAPEAFSEGTVESARDWLEGPTSGEAGQAWRDYMGRHGHRSLRELDVRQPEWAYDPEPLIRSLQAQLRARQEEDVVKAQRPQAPSVALGRLRWVAPMAHAAVRNRERSKSLLVSTTVHFKRAYRALGLQLVSEGRLPDADAVFFLLHEELGACAEGVDGLDWATIAVARRGLLPYQQSLRFPEVTVGRPEPERPAPPQAGADRVVGKPVSRGQVEGFVRVVHSLAEAEALRPGEILVSSITDVGWTPYFAIIAGLVTDVGSAVSHGAVVAREYGLPAVLNTGHGTEVLTTGDRVRLDGDTGIVEILDPVNSA